MLGIKIGQLNGGLFLYNGTLLYGDPFLKNMVKFNLELM